MDIAGEARNVGRLRHKTLKGVRGSLRQQWIILPGTKERLSTLKLDALVKIQITQRGIRRHGARLLKDKCQLRRREPTQYIERLHIPNHRARVPLHPNPWRISKDQVESAGVGENVSKLQFPVKEPVF